MELYRRAYSLFFFPLCVRLTGFAVEVQLDSVKENQKESIRRTLFLDSRQPSLIKTFSLANSEHLCHETKVYLRVSHISMSSRLLNVAYDQMILSMFLYYTFDLQEEICKGDAGSSVRLHVSMLLL